MKKKFILILLGWTILNMVIDVKVFSIDYLLVIISVLLIIIGYTNRFD